MPIPSAVVIELTGEERSVLESWTRRHTSAQALALRARIVLGAAGSLTNGEIACSLGVSRPTVTKWRNRFAKQRLEGLLDEPRPGRPRTITDEQVERVVITTLESVPKGRDALVDAVDGPRGGDDAGCGDADLARVRAATQSAGDLEAVQGPAVHREGPRHLRPVPQPARASGGPGGRREIADPSVGPDHADPADVARHPRARDPRL